MILGRKYADNNPARAADLTSRERGVRQLRATFRRILQIVFLIFVFAVVQMFTLWAVCNTGMKTAASLERQGLPTLNTLASLQEHLATYRLNSYEYLFARDAEREAKAKAAETVATQARSEVAEIRRLLPEDAGRQLAANLGEAIDDLDAEFRRVRNLVDTDFSAAMKAMDQNIPPRAERVASAAVALKEYGYRFSGGQVGATFGSFGWIKKNAIIFAASNILVALGAVIFILLAARRSRAQLSHMLARLDERTRELAGSLSQVNATLEATADGIVFIDPEGNVGNFNQQFATMWGVSEPAGTPHDHRLRLMAFVGPLLPHPEAFAGKLEDLAVHPERETFDVLELADQRVFECHSKPQRLEGRVCGRVWSFRDITAQRRMRREAEEAHRQLLQASRLAGMAEVATNVLHNVGNVLNSVNISADVLADAVRRSKVSNLPKVVTLLREHEGDLGAYLTADPRGKGLTGFLSHLAEHLMADQREAIQELDSLRANIEHIKEIVAMQQNYATVSGVREIISIRQLVEDSIRMSVGDMNPRNTRVVTEFEETPLINTDRHKVLQILVNLVRNAKHACQDSGRPDRIIKVRVANGADRIRITVADNGIGIPPENLTRIFNHGFTTRKDGHGFGLHSGALAAREMGGSLTAHSEGPRCGATFTLELPCTAGDDTPPASSGRENPRVTDAISQG